MDDRLRALAAQQGGVVTWAQARALGVPQSALGGRAATTPLVRVRPNAYAERTRLARLTAPGQVAVAVAAERLATGVDVVASGLTAAVLHGLPVLGAGPAVPVLSERRDDRPRHRGQSTTLRPDEVTELYGVPVTTPARTAVDVARRHGWLHGVVVADAVLARGVARDELLAVLSGRSRWPGSAAARRAVAFADGRSESPLESLGRVRMHEHGLPPPELQVVLGDDHGPIGRVDHYWPEHHTIGEGDGALKYAGGTGLFAEKLREDRFRDARFEVVRYTWDEAWRRPQLVVARILAAFARSAARNRPTGT